MSFAVIILAYPLGTCIKDTKSPWIYVIFARGGGAQHLVFISRVEQLADEAGDPVCSEEIEEGVNMLWTDDTEEAYPSSTDFLCSRHLFLFIAFAGNSSSGHWTRK